LGEIVEQDEYDIHNAGRFRRLDKLNCKRRRLAAANAERC